MDASDNLATNISQDSTSTPSSDLTALKELHYTVSSDKTLIPVQIKVEPAATTATAVTNTIQDVSNTSPECPSLGISNITEANTTVISNSSIESPPLMTFTNATSNTSMSFSRELATTTITSSTDVSNTSSLSQMAPTTSITTGVVSNTFTGSQLLAQNSICSDIPITQAPLNLPQEQNFRWGRKQVNALIDKVSEHFEEFYDHSVKKKEIWQIIAASMSQEGYKCTSSDCDKKWRNLKATYLKVLRKQILGCTDYRFEHFSQLHNILGKEIDPLGMREQALSDGKEQIVKSVQANQHSPSYEDSATEDGGHWSNSAVEHLLDLIQEERLLLNTVNANTAWQRIAQQMNVNVEAQEVTIANCRSKWTSLKKDFNYYQQQASLIGSVPLWPFFTRVRHVLSSLKMNADENVSDISHSKVINSQVHRPGSMLERLEQIETEMSVTDRVSKLEAQVEATQKIREARTQTNNLLQQVLLELRSITDSLEAENLHRQNFEHRIDPSTRMSINGRPQQQQHTSNNQPGIIIVEAYQDELT